MGPVWLPLAADISAIVALVIAILSTTSWSGRKKMTVLGAMVAGIGFGLLTSYIHTYQARLVYGDFEWQWAGDGWLGQVSIKRDAENIPISEVDVRKFSHTDERYEAKQVMLSSGPGSIQGDKKGFKLTLPVLRTFEEEQQEKVMHQTLEADLVPVEAYAGRVKYISSDGSSVGDMILVRYRSTPQMFEPISSQR